MKAFQVTLVAVCLMVATPGAAAQRWLEVRALVIDEDDDPRPLEGAAALRVHHAGEQISSRLEHGAFRLPALAMLKPQAAPVPLDISIEGYATCVPPTLLVEDAEATGNQVATVLLIKGPSEGPGRCGVRIAASIIRQISWPWPRRAPWRLKSIQLVEPWAARHGLSPEAVAGALEQWTRQAERDKGGDERELVLAALMKGDYPAAVRSASSTMRGEAGQTTSRGSLEALTLLATAYNADGQSMAAIDLYDRGIQQASVQGDRQLLRAAMSGKAYALAALSASQGDSREPLEMATRLYRQILEGCSYEQGAWEWAEAQRELAVALIFEAWLFQGKAALERMREANMLHRNTLRVFTPEQAPSEWLRVHGAVGATFRLQGELLLASGSEDVTGVFQQAVVAYRDGLRVCNGGRMLSGCKLAWDSLGSLLLVVAKRTGDESRLRILQESADAYRAALKVQELDSREERVPAWLGLGESLTLLGKQLADDRGTRWLEEAVGAYQQALEVLKPAGEADRWASVQFELAFATMALGERQRGEGRSRWLGQAAGLFRELFTVYTLERRPTDWAKTKVMLALALLARAETEDASAAQGVLKEGLKMLDDASQVYTQERPKQWQAVQALRCLALSFQESFMYMSRSGEKSAIKASEVCHQASQIVSDQEPAWKTTVQMGICMNAQVESLDAPAESRAEVLDRAIGACRGVLLASSAQGQEARRAGVQLMLGVALDLRAAWAKTVDEKIQLWEESVSTLRESLKFLKHGSHPWQWAIAQRQQGAVLASLGTWRGGGAGAQELEASVQVLQELITTTTHDEIPYIWTLAHSNLCYAQQWLGLRAADKAAGLRLLEEAVRSCNQAVKIFEPGNHPEEWTQAKSNLDHAQRKLAQRDMTAPGLQTADDDILGSGPPADHGVPSPTPADVEPPDSALQEDSRMLVGRVLISVERGNEIPPSTSATIRISGFDVVTESFPGSGLFKLPLPVSVMPGDLLNLGVFLSGYEMVYPPGGRVHVPHERGAEPIKVVMRPVSEKTAQQEEALEQVTGSFIRERKHIFLEERTLRADLLAVDWIKAAELGRLSLEAGTLDAEYEQKMLGIEMLRGREVRLAIEAMVESRYREAITHAKSAVRQSEDSLRKAGSTGDQVQTERAKQKVVEDLILLGDLHSVVFEFTSALETYRRALAYANREVDSRHWAWLNSSIGRAQTFIGMTVFSPDLKPDSNERYLRSALVHLDRSLEVYARGQMLTELADIQLMRGFALFQLELLGTLPSDRDRTAKGQELMESIAAYREALRIFERERQPLLWSLAKSFLGQALVALGRKVRGEAGLEYSREAIQVLREALLISTRSRSPQFWAAIQVHLGMAFYNLGALSSNPAERVKWFTEAEAALLLALDIFNRDSIPRDRAAVQLNIALVYTQLGMLEQAEPRRTQLQQRATHSCQQALDLLALGIPATVCELLELMIDYI
jgi:tetratricopeptide (TPR) repeat protein